MICEYPNCKHEAYKWLHDKKFCWIHYLIEKADEELEGKEEVYGK